MYLFIEKRSNVCTGVFQCPYLLIKYKIMFFATYYRDHLPLTITSLRVLKSEDKNTMDCNLIVLIQFTLDWIVSILNVVRKYKKKSFL